MTLEEVRLEINKIDEEMKELFDKRQLCTDRVALIKQESNDCIYKPDREREIVEHFSKTGENNYCELIKKVMMLSRKSQYKIFLQDKNTYQSFIGKLSKNQLKALMSGGSLRIKINISSRVDGLSYNDILAIISQSELNIIMIKSKKNMLTMEFNLDNEVSMHEAMTLLYMLQNESTLI